LIKEIITKEIVKPSKMHMTPNIDVESIWGWNSEIVKKMQASSTVLPHQGSKVGSHNKNIKISIQAILILLIISNYL